MLCHILTLAFAEYGRSSNTGKLLLRACGEQARLLINGLDRHEAVLRQMLENERDRTIVLFPSTNSLTVKQLRQRLRQTGSVWDARDAENEIAAAADEKAPASDEAADDDEADADANDCSVPPLHWDELSASPFESTVKSGNSSAADRKVEQSSTSDSAAESAVLAACDDEPALNILVLDGTWRQARQLRWILSNRVTFVRLASVGGKRCFCSLAHFITPLVAFSACLGT